MRNSLKSSLTRLVEKALATSCRQGLLGLLTDPGNTPVVLEHPRRPGQGDYACGVAFKLAGRAKMSSMNIAEVLWHQLASEIAELCSVTCVAPGYLNFTLGNAALQNVLKEIHALGPGYGRSQAGAGQKVLLQCLFHKPDAELQIEQARSAVYGSCLGNLLRFCAYEVVEEACFLDASDQAGAGLIHQTQNDLLAKLKVRFSCLSAAAPPASVKHESAYNLIIRIAGHSCLKKAGELETTRQAPGQERLNLELIPVAAVHLCMESTAAGNPVPGATGDPLFGLVENLGSDDLRYYLAGADPEKSLDLRLLPLRESGRENPAFYVRYAHARASAVLRLVQEPACRPDFADEEPVVSPEKWQQWLSLYKNSSRAYAALFNGCVELETSARQLIMLLSSFGGEVEEALLARRPGRLAHYAFQLACRLLEFCQACCIISADESVVCARLGLVSAVRQVLTNTLEIIGLTAPTQM